MDAPKLDGRNYDDVVAQTEALAEVYTAPDGWRPPADGSIDLGRALVRLFGSMVDHVITQLNKVPDKHHLAFTQLLGASRIPPAAARAAITFSLDETTRTTPVPAGAQIGGVAADGSSVVFETEQALPLTRAKLDSVFVRDVPLGRYADRSLAAVTGTPAGYPGLGAPAATNDQDSHPIEHEAYLQIAALDALGASKLSITTTPAQGQALPATGPNWYTFDAKGAPTKLGSGWALSNADATACNAPPAPISSLTGRVVYAVMPASPPLTFATTVTIDAPAQPVAAAFVNGLPADLTRDVMIFGDHPRIGDTFFIAADDALALGGATITLTPTFTAVGGPQGLTLAWDVWDGQQGTTVTASGAANQFSAAGTITFTAPALPVKRATIAGITSRWIRVRITAGNYGVDAHPAMSGSTVTIVASNLAPPVVSSLKIQWTGSIASPPTALIRRTALTYDSIDPTVPSSMFVAAPEIIYQGQADKTSSVNLGFDAAFEPTVTTIYIQVMPPIAPLPADYKAPPPTRKPVHVVWEYWNGAWTTLAVDDGTAGLARSGLVRFVPVNDAKPLEQFGRKRYWLRARTADTSDFEPMPLLGRIATNTMWAAHAHTIEGEILGSSLGTAGQSFHLSQVPVLDGERIEIAEPEPTGLEQTDLATDGSLAIETDPSGKPVYWIRWKPVADFWASGPRDRHYTIDCATGVVTFGDGVRGMLPPRGSQSVRASYSSGGGVTGNVAAGTLVQLKTTVPVVKSVANVEIASGGSAIEAVPAMMDRASRWLRHGGRAVTAEDFADLALESSTAIARAVAISPSFWPIDQADGPKTDPASLQRDGKVIVVVVPTEPRPGYSPSVDLLGSVESYLVARCAPAVTLQVIGPCWVGVDIVIHVVARSIAESDSVLVTVREAIVRLFDPLVGGDGGGWEFGRKPRSSDIVAVVETIPAVDHLSYLSIVCDPPLNTGEGDEITLDELSLQPRLLAYARNITVAHPGKP